MTNKFQNKLSGQSLADYSLCVGLIAVVSVAVLSTLGSTLSDQLAASIGFELHVSRTGSTPGQLDSPSTDGQFSSRIPRPGAGSQQICFASGLCANIPVIPTQPDSRLVEVDGGNGTEMTHKFSSVLEQLAAQMEQDNRDPGLIAMIRDLANQGHDFGEKQKIFASTACQNGLQGLNCSEVDVRDVQALTNGSTRFIDTLGSINQYLGSHSELPPEIRLIVDSQAGQINQIFNSYNSTLAGKSGFEPEGVNTGNLENLSVNGTLTHQSANDICTQSGDSSCQQAG